MDLCWFSATGRVASAEGVMHDEYSINQFLREECVVRADSKVPTISLYRTYLDWSKEHGFQPTHIVRFTRVLGEQGFHFWRDKSIRYVVGLALSPSGKCDFPTHHMYDGKSMSCPACNHEKNSNDRTTHGINRGQQLALKTTALCRAIQDLLSATKEFVLGIFN